MNFRLSGVAFASVLLIGCISNHNQDDQGQCDPLEGFNRSMFDFNYNVLDPYIVRPAALVWRDYALKPLRNGLSNFFTNLEEPATMVNYLLEGKSYKAMVHFNRFFLNTLLGMGGLIDVASMANAKLAKEESRRFGSILGNYGVGYGTYLQLPGYGSFTPRENVGGLVDDLYPMLSYLTWWMSISKWVLEGLETRAQLLDSDGLLRNSKDPYSMIRTAYFQRHEFLISDGVLPLQKTLNAAEDIKGDLQSIDM
ncbi:phospholipid-binding lipoprotein MlaA [Candidatus Hoaglandella endobia]|uniref:Putative phospholipid-binding lipoprotein MlaA n=1 Tax=Candidatus Hoaglandella endobia TaxID=1778263 RepID=A0A143WTW5_9ENTR|nr:phospholipid-binding lipoprotein MlaA [Candidatus Hoaglandella endobia]CUX97190.1 putative phospholipid-binding lipoprotein MlaA precursor [Candidatus Hoaglandella endobia]